MEITSTAQNILEKRYYRSNESEPEEMFRRVAKEVSSPEENQEEWEEIFYDMMINKEFIPNSPTMMNAGTEMNNLSACFVLPVEDDLSNIYETLKKAALIFKSGGGCGFSFSKLRQEGALVRSSGGESSGPISFMKDFDRMAETVEQGGRRRGAMLGSLSVHHPDILDFISAKREEGVLENFNISVEITDEFLEAVKERKDYELRNPMGGHPNDPENDMVVSRIKATEVFEEICKGIWLNGEPGILFVDKVNEENDYDEIGDEDYISTTNPCGEQPLPSYGSCNLGHINLSQFVKDEDFDWEAMGEMVKYGVRFLDDVISVAKFPIPEIEKRAKDERRVGLGVAGWHEALLKLGLRYDSDEAIELARKTSKFIYEKAKKASGGRNKKLLTVAPTGTTSMILGTTYGIEPLHQISEEKEVLDGEIMENKNPVVQKIQEESDPENILVTGPEISPKRHVDMQAAWQEFVDASISKTINLPKDFSEEQIGEIIFYGWEKGLKGMTMYREGSRVSEPIKTGETKKLPKRPRKMESNTYREPLSCGRTLYPTVTKDETGRVQEIFVRGLGKIGECVSAWAESFSRVASLYLRVGGDPQRLIDTLRGIRCPEGKNSCPNIIAKILEEETKNEE